MMFEYNDIMTKRNKYEEKSPEWNFFNTILSGMNLFMNKRRPGRFSANGRDVEVRFDYELNCWIAEIHLRPSQLNSSHQTTDRDTQYAQNTYPVQNTQYAQNTYPVQNTQYAQNDYPSRSQFKSSHQATDRDTQYAQNIYSGRSQFKSSHQTANAPAANHHQSPRVTPTASPPLPQYTPPKPATWSSTQPTEPWDPKNLINADQAQLQSRGVISSIQFSHDQVSDQDDQDKTLKSKSWEIHAATIRGKSHHHQGLWRDDQFAISTRGAFTHLTVCDGAGSAPLSRIGAYLASSYVNFEMMESLSSLSLDDHPFDPQTRSPRALLVEIKKQLINSYQSAITQLEKYARQAMAPITHLNSTLLHLTTWRQYHESEYYDCFAFMQIGDGAGALIHRDDKLTLLIDPKHGEHGGETEFIKATSTPKIVFTIKPASPNHQDSVRAFALMTDGVSDDFFPESERLKDLFNGEALEGFSASATSKENINGLLKSGSAMTSSELRSWIKYDKKQSFDDRTLIFGNPL